MQYRHEIDGLRAVAVIPVILFHAGFTIFSGGYVGVDVFFVISGFLITSIIINELELGAFSLLGFYERRARRILPALFFVMLCCIPLAWVWMLPDQFKDFSESLIAVSLFASNILFWQESGYFAATSELKPLLHTWSLAVEEQYYTLFPIFLIVLWRFGRNSVFFFVVAVFVISLVLSEWGWRNAPVANFYLIPTRAWELFAGSICAFLIKGSTPKSSNPLSALGLTMIVSSMFLFDDKTPFPSIYALAPVAGTALIILYGSSQTWVARLLSLDVFVGVGLVSYSAYLWHQPLFAFARIRNVFLPEQWLMLFLSIASLGLAYLSWRFVEKPFRMRSEFAPISRRAIFGLSGIVGTFFVMFGAYGTLQNGISNRFSFDAEALEYIEFFDNSLPEMAYFEREDIFKDFRAECNFFNIQKYRNGERTKIPRKNIATSCFTLDDSIGHSVFIWGDSHAQMLNIGLHENLPIDWQILQVASSGCDAQIQLVEDRSDHCTFSNWFALQTITEVLPDVVLIGQAAGHDTKKMDALVEGLKNLGIRKIVFTGPSPHWQPDLPDLITMRLWNNTPRRTFFGADKKLIELNETLKREFLQTSEVKFVSIIDALCTESGCLTYLGDDRKTGITSWDYGHLTPIASKYFAKQFLVEVVTDGFE